MTPKQKSKMVERYERALRALGKATVVINAELRRSVGKSPRELRSAVAAAELRLKKRRELGIINGVRPRRDLWVIHRGRGRVYGRILRVRRNGDVVWLGDLGVPTTTKPGALAAGGYEYVEHARKGGCQ